MPANSRKIDMGLSGYWHNRYGLFAFWSILHFIFNDLPLFDHTIAFHLNSGEVNEYIFLLVASNKSVTLGWIEPFDGSC